MAFLQLRRARVAQFRRFLTSRAAAIAHGEVPPVYAGGQPHGARSVELGPCVRRRRDAKIEALAATPRRGALHCFPRRGPPGAARIIGHTGVTEE